MPQEPYRSQYPIHFDSADWMTWRCGAAEPADLHVVVLCAWIAAGVTLILLGYLRQQRRLAQQVELRLLHA
jgi:hypothetical protein